MGRLWWGGRRNWEVCCLLSCTFRNFRFQNGSLIETWLNVFAFFLFFFLYFLCLEALNSSELGDFRIRDHFFLYPFLAPDVYHLGAKSCLIKPISKFHRSMEIYLVIYLVYLGWFHSIYWEMALLFKLIFKEAVPAHNIFRRYRREFLFPLFLCCLPLSHSVPQNHLLLYPFYNTYTWIQPSQHYMSSFVFFF